MQTERLKLVTIVVESVLADQLIAAIKRLGSTGYTVTDARGQGSRGRRVGEVPGDNRRIDVIVSDVVADRILTLLDAEYFPNYAVAAWTSDIEVVRGAKYASP